MRPVEFPEQDVVIAKDQPQYLPLPAYRHRDETGALTFCWKLDLWERLYLLATGRLWHTVLAFGQPLQPQLLEVQRPAMPQRDVGGLPRNLRAVRDWLLCADVPVDCFSCQVRALLVAGAMVGLIALGVEVLGR